MNFGERQDARTSRPRAHINFPGLNLACVNAIKHFYQYPQYGREEARFQEYDQTARQQLFAVASEWSANVQSPPSNGGFFNPVQGMRAEQDRYDVILHEAASKFSSVSVFFIAVEVKQSLKVLILSCTTRPVSPCTLYEFRTAADPLPPPFDRTVQMRYALTLKWRRANQRMARPEDWNLDEDAQHLNVEDLNHRVAEAESHAGLGRHIPGVCAKVSVLSRG